MVNRLSILAGILLYAATTPAQPLKDRVLVVYNSHPSFVTDSLDVANDYITKRAIPANRLCPVSFSNEIEVSLPAWIAAAGPRAAIRTCLNNLGASNILYVVMAYKTPYLLFNFNGAGTTSSVDSYIADIWDTLYSTFLTSSPVAAHRYHDAAQSQGNLYGAFQTFATHRAQPRSQLIYSVWRLDGATPAIAKGLVQKAITAETAGGVDMAAGRKVYIDRKNTGNGLDIQDNTGDYDLLRASQFASSALGAGNVVVDTNAAEFGVGAAPNAMLYCGWYSYNNYNPPGTFTWPAGAIGWHLDSASALSPRSGVNWSANALLEGITVTSGAMNEPFLQGMAHPDVVFRHLLAGGNVGDAFLRGTRWLRWMILNFGDPLYVPFPGGRAPFIAPATAASLELKAQEGIVGGYPTSGIVTLEAASVNPQVVNLSATAGIALPPSVSVPANQLKATFAITSSPVTAGTAALVTAVSGGTTLTNTIGLYPMLAGVATPSSLASGGTGTAYAILNDRAPFGGVTVLLSSNSPALTVPASATVPFGSTAVAFTITACSSGCPALPASVNITSTFAGTQTIATVTVTP